MDVLKQGAVIAVIGYIMVFVVLSIIWGILSLTKIFFVQKDTGIKTEPPDISPVQQAKENNTDEDELIAVLTAAVAASLNTSSYNLNIKSYRQIGQNSPAWNKTSRQENLS